MILLAPDPAAAVATSFPAFAELSHDARATLAYGLVALYVAFAGAELALGIGTLAGRGWAWPWGIVMSVLLIVFGVLTLPRGLVGSVIHAAILTYLMTPRVRGSFGKAAIRGHGAGDGGEGLGRADG